MNNESEKPSKRIADRLPVHQPDSNMWEKLSQQLDAADSQNRFEQLLENLPVYSPPPSTWSRIESRLNRTIYLRRTLIAVSGIAATLLMMFSVIKLSEQQSPISGGDKQIAENIAAPDQQNRLSAEVNNDNASNMAALQSSIRKTSPSAYNTKTAITKESIENKGIAASSEPVKPYEADELLPAVAGDVTELQAEETGKADVIHTEDQALAIQATPVQKIDKNFLLNNNPLPVLPEEQQRGDLSLALGYLPEPVETGAGNSLFHNIGLSATITRDNFRIQSGIGMAYSNHDVVYNLNYTQQIWVPVAHPGGPNDTTNIRINNSFSELKGTEKHQYITYDLGVGRKLFTAGKMSAWLNAGAGLAYRLDKGDLRSETIERLQDNYNMHVSDVELDLPSYNRLNINLMTGVDFNYAIIRRLSLSFTPLGRLYLKPILEKEGNATDPFTFGFRTGMKFDF